MKRILVFVAFLCAMSAFPKTRIISPVHGTWGNAQVLALESDDEYVYYSVDGSDPAITGFAYDGPVLIDKAGDVVLRVSVGKDEREIKTIEYTVNAGAMPKDAFLADAIRTGFVDYVSGRALDIPSEYRCNIGGVEIGQDSGVFCAEENVLEHNLRITMVRRDLSTNNLSTMDEKGGNKDCVCYSFVLRVLPCDGGAKALAEKTGENTSSGGRPWSMFGWKYIWLNDPKYIYRIDDGMWVGRASKPVVIDRKKRHTIYWQSVAYKKGRHAESFDLPPIPHLYTSEGKNGGTTITVKDAGYAIGIKTKNGVWFRDSVLLDTVNGNETSGVYSTAMYYKDVYQGAIAIPYSIDRCPPAVPVFESSVANGKTTRGDVDVTVIGERDSALYVSVDGGDWEKTYIENLPGIVPSRMVTLQSDTAVQSDNVSKEHNIRAYSVDNFGNISAAAQYSVMIDKYCYYVDEVNGKHGAFGDSEAPLSSIADCLTLDTARITVRGTAHIGQEELRRIQEGVNDLTIEGERGDEHLLIGGTLQGRSRVTLKNLIVERDSKKEVVSLSNGASTTPPLIVCRGGTIMLEGCEAFTDCGQSGTVIHCDGGAVIVKNSGLTSVARLRAAAIVTADADVQISGTRISCGAMESVCVSCVRGQVLVEGSILSVKGDRAHGVELFGTRSCIRSNTLEANLSGGGKSIYCDVLNEAVEHHDNVERGWER